MLSIGEIINLVIFSISILSNGLVLSLYPHFKINNTINAGNLVIFLQSFTDTLFTITSLIFHNELVAQQSYCSIFFIYFNQFQLSHNTFLLFGFIYTCTLNFNFFMMALTIWARYLAISGEYKLKIKVLLLIFFLNGIAVMLLSAHIVYFGVDHDADPYIIYKFDQQNNYTDTYVKATSTSISLKTSGLKFFAILLPIAFYININLFMIIKFLQKYRIFMKSQFSLMSTRTRTLGYDFLRILYFQICNPVAFMFIPIILYFVAILLNLNVRSFGSVIIQLAGVVSPLNAIFVVIGLTKSRRIMLNRCNRILFTVSCRKRKILRNNISTVLSKPSVTVKQKRLMFQLFLIELNKKLQIKTILFT
uniref:G_PROTEIN_RECEP_F1_2 domain-containing protein n=1 Tax=Rhabditophanes sp. KR3021 TaxID=114890 RepID=A0AC35TXW5_9BILA